MTHRAGRVWTLSETASKNWWVKNLKCKGCNKGFKPGQRVIQATTTPRRTWANKENGYARIRHIECFVDAKGEPIVKA